jgi:DNA repair protein RecO
MEGVGSLLGDIRDKGIILQRKVMGDDDLVVRILSQKHGQIVTYAFRALRSKRRFVNACEVMRHIQFYAKRNKQGGLTLEEVCTLNYFPHLTESYQAYQAAARALVLVRKLAPLEVSNEALFVLTGSFLQILQNPAEAENFLGFEIKALQLSGMLALGEQCLQCKKPVQELTVYLSHQGLMCENCTSVGWKDREERRGLSPEDQIQVREFLNARVSAKLFQAIPYLKPILFRLKPVIEEVYQDYGFGFD